jgi:hypothetical protein
MNRIPAFSSWQSANLDALIGDTRFPLIGLQEYSDRPGEFRVALPNGKTVQICRHRFDYVFRAI